jgi:hypothetical protein
MEQSNLILDKEGGVSEDPLQDEESLFNEEIEKEIKGETNYFAATYHTLKLPRSPSIPVKKLLEETFKALTLSNRAEFI